MITSQQMVVDAGDSPAARLDAWLHTRFPACRKSWIKAAIERGDVLRNGRPCAKSERLHPGDRIDILRLLEPADYKVLPNPAIPLTIRRRDDTFLALSKPPGMPVHPLALEETDTLANGLVAAFPETQHIGDDPLFPAFVHRIDTDTSGLVLAALTPDAYENLRRQFSSRHVVKEYTALVHGAPLAKGLLRDYLGHRPGGSRVMTVLPSHGKSGAKDRYLAVSEYSVVRRYPAHSLLSIRIYTGITHQIRCQFAYAGFPLAGDKAYGRREDESWMCRHFLHAARLEFTHPKTGQRIDVEDPLPKDLQDVLDRLNRESL